MRLKTSSFLFGQMMEAVYSWIFLLAVWAGAKKNKGKGKRFFLEYYTSLTTLNAVDHSVRERLEFILGGRGVTQNRGPARDKGRIRLPLVMAQQLASLPTTKKNWLKTLILSYSNFLWRGDKYSQQRSRSPWRLFVININPKVQRCLIVRSEKP